MLYNSDADKILLLYPMDTDQQMMTLKNRKI